MGVEPPREEAMRIVIGNLPADVDEEGIREALSVFAPVETISLVHESGAPTAVIELDTTRPHAEQLAQRIRGRLFQGQALTAWIPTMSW
jgi:RNA recognition motif. (a.k.a. RRM, RBD, or RNP domain)